MRKLRFSEVKYLAKISQKGVKEPEFQPRSRCSKSCVLKPTTPSAYLKPLSLPPVFSSCFSRKGLCRHTPLVLWVPVSRCLSEHGLSAAQVDLQIKPHSPLQHFESSSMDQVQALLLRIVIPTNSTFSPIPCAFSHHRTSYKRGRLVGKELDIFGCTGHR